MLTYKRMASYLRGTRSTPEASLVRLPLAALVAAGALACGGASQRPRSYGPPGGQRARPRRHLDETRRAQATPHRDPEISRPRRLPRARRADPGAGQRAPAAVLRR